MSASNATTRRPTSVDTPDGLAFGVSAFLLWGVVPLYFKLMDHVPVWELLAHRIVWSLVLAGAIVTIARRWRQVGELLASRHAILALTAAAVILGANWGTYLYAVLTDRLLQGSLGYFINPLVTVALAALVLRERLGARQWLAVGIAGVGVLCQLVLAGELPWIALFLAFSFAIYGLIRKTAPAEAQVGLFFETAVLAPFCLAYLVWLAAIGTGQFGTLSFGNDLWLILSGPVTAVPLVLWAAGARRLRLATIGLLQYIAPTAQFVIAVAVFGEPFGTVDLVTFALIWIALAVYSTGRRPVATEPA